MAIKILMVNQFSAGEYLWDGDKSSDRRIYVCTDALKMDWICKRPSGGGGGINAIIMTSEVGKSFVNHGEKF